jgi:hypothetical protein
MGATTLSITAFSIMTLNITKHKIQLNDTQCTVMLSAIYAEYCYADCRK